MCVLVGIVTVQRCHRRHSIGASDWQSNMSRTFKAAGTGGEVAAVRYRSLALTEFPQLSSFDQSRRTLD